MFTCFVKDVFDDSDISYISSMQQFRGNCIFAKKLIELMKLPDYTHTVYHITTYICMWMYVYYTCIHICTYIRAGGVHPIHGICTKIRICNTACEFLLEGRVLDMRIKFLTGCKG